jgi:hypothetical protein
MLSKKNIITALFLLTYSITLHAGFPINPDSQEESLRFGREFNAVGRIDFEGRGAGSGVLIDVESIGLPSTFQNRVIATVSHVFRRFIDAFGYKRFPVKHHSLESIEAASSTLKKYTFKINLESDTTKPENYHSFDIQQVYLCDNYHPYNKKTKLLDQVAFAILKESVKNVIPIRLMETGAADYMGKNVYQVGYGVSGFMNTRQFFYDGVKRAGGLTINSVNPAASIMEYELKFDSNGQAPQAALSPGGDSITFEMDAVEKTMEISRLDSSINSPVFQQLLKHYNIIHIYRQIEAELRKLERDPYNRSALYHTWHGVKLVSPLRLTKAPKNPTIIQAGDSGGATLYHDGHKWGLAGLIVASNVSIRMDEEPTSCYEYFLKILYSRKFLHRLLPERITPEQPVMQESDIRLKPSILTRDGQEKLKQVGIRSYACDLDQLDDSSFFNRTVSRLKFKIQRALGLYQYPGLAVTIVTPYSYALKFSHALESVNYETGNKPLVLYPFKVPQEALLTIHKAHQSSPHIFG